MCLTIIPVDIQHLRECLPLKIHGRTIKSHPNTNRRAGKMVIHILTCLSLTAVTSYVFALKLFDLDKVHDTPSEEQIV
jgi:hypothetical protein